MIPYYVSVPRAYAELMVEEANSRGIRAQAIRAGHRSDMWTVLVPRGQEDEANRLVHAITYAVGKKWGSRQSNPADTSADLYETFHGAPSTGELEIEEQVHAHSYLAELGTLVELKVSTLSKLDAVIEFESGSRPVLCSNEDGTQLYIRGGDQSLDLDALKMGADKWLKDSMVIGVLYELTYETAKGFDKFKLTEYYHDLGEETGIQPMLVYDSLSQLMSVSGGQYKVKDVGITN
jgi:hypothetical protein